jgi:rubrerythrin
MAMEERAIKLYADRAAETRDPEEQKLYRWLSGWENGHLKILMEMDRELTEKIWHDNQFWPF